MMDLVNIYDNTAHYDYQEGTFDEAYNAECNSTVDYNAKKQHFQCCDKAESRLDQK